MGYFASQPPNLGSSARLLLKSNGRVLDARKSNPIISMYNRGVVVLLPPVVLKMYSSGDLLTLTQTKMVNWSSYTSTAFCLSFLLPIDGETRGYEPILFCQESV